MRYQRADMDGSVIIFGDAIKPGQAGNIHHCIDAFANSAFEFEHQIGAASDQAGLFPFFCKDLEGFFNRSGCDVIFSTCRY